MASLGIGAPMLVKLRCFGSIRAQVDCEHEQLDLADGLSVGEVVASLSARSGKWRAALADDNLLTAVNLEFCSAEQLLRDGDELALMPPVTGG